MNNVIPALPRHIQFPRLVRLAKARMNIAMTGPSGSGKSTAASQLATELGLPFYVVEQAVMPSDVIGGRDPLDKDEWRKTGLIRAALYGGVVILEEFDAWAPRPTLAANPLLANRIVINPVTGEVLPLHKDCIIIAAMNTWGAGATMEYVGRNKMDAATLDRFGARIHWDYDEKLERAMCGDDEVSEFVQLCRRNAGAAKLKVLISPRASVNIALMTQKGFTMREAAEMSFLAGLSRADRNVILNGADEYLAEGGELPFRYVR